MLLKVGKRYRSRDGETEALIVKQADKTDPVFSKHHPFVDEEGYVYRKDGRIHPDKDLPFDLVAEVIPRRQRRLVR